MKTFIDTINFRSKKLVGFPAVGPALYPHRNLPDVHTAGKLCRTECFV